MKKMLIGLGLLIVFGMIAVVSANPLYVDYTEKYNVSAYVSGDGSTIYSINNITGYITINNTATDINDTLYDVWVAVNISNNITGLTLVYNGTPKGVFIESSAPAYTGLGSADLYIHIPILLPNSYVQYSFGINTSKFGVPILVDEAYSADKIPAGKESNWTVYINISRNTSALPDPNTVVYVNMTKYLSNDSNNYGSEYWTKLNISGVSSTQGTTTLWDGPYFTGAANDSLNWTGVILNNAQNGTIEFNVTGINTYQNRSPIKLKYGFAVITFSYDGTVSGSKICGIYATGMGRINAVKDGPYKNTTTGKYNIWYENATIENTASSYAFNVTRMNLWAINGSDPTNVNPFNSSLLIPGSSHSFTPYTLINPGESWSTGTYNFTFDDVPVVWANCTFTVAEDNITLLNRTVHAYDSEYGSSYIVIEEIYVVGSYLIKVTKHIIPNSDGTYDVYLVVENIGSEKSPYVYVYDLIPNNFNVSNMWVNRSEMLAQHADGDPNNNYTGNKTLSGDYSLSYWWALNSIYPNADGDGDYNDATEINNNQTVVIHYTLNGTGEFKPTDAFLVGIDPKHSLAPSTSPKTVLAGGAVSNNFESLLALASGMIGIGAILRRKTKGKYKNN
ncbi:hypothetical protein [Methanotorris igneus]|uniref:Uncharacterized protein n=1 Tax=Methanotorris igneus (strain DSM 5666 / JCM 11834 / Kol 5) TaxID=880724 RepID=F6BEP3_METIK|nr:hypothetical protein [Methanotorris igneus]AEF96840.1 hypothetical protein Metig_1303 [Methanotorris igneus Kol 5]